MPWRPFDTPAGLPPSGPHQPILPDRPAPPAASSPAGHAVRIIECTRRPLLSCPRCHGTALQRNGHANGLQRFRCPACGRTFNSLTGTPLARLRRKDKWLDFCATLLDPATTVRSAAGRVAVHRNTSFRWRHRMLELPKFDRQFPLRSVVELDLLCLRESRKGARTLARPPRKRATRRASRRLRATRYACCWRAIARDARTTRS